jgi:DNA-binding CsgD family transcriptional regulator
MPPAPGAQCPLSLRELDTVRLLAKGRVYKQIASEQGVVTSTVRTRLHMIYRKLGVNNRAQAVIECSRRGWIPGLDAGDAQLHRLERLLAELAAAVRDARRFHRLTLTQRAYLVALEAHLCARGELQERATARARDEAFAALCAEAGLTPKGVRRLAGRAA